MNTEPVSSPRASRGQPQLEFRRLWQGVGWLMVIIVIWLSLTPQPPQVPDLLAWDKSQHATAYTGLMYWFRQAFAPRWWWPAFLLALGIALECLQAYTDVRVADPADIVANSLGVAIGLALALSPLGGLLSAIDARLAHRARSTPLG